MILNLKDRRFGRLKVLERIPSPPKKVRWLCQCDCGTKQIIWRGNLTSGQATSCRRCARAVNLKRKRFGRLKVLEQAAPSNGQTMWHCRCDCGNTRTYRGAVLRFGSVKSCGCARAESVRKAHIKHGLSDSPTYNSWKSMLTRCNPNRNHPSDRKHYIDKGVTVCTRWSGEKGFKNFLKDMGERPPGMTLDRYPNIRPDPDGLIGHGYYPANCRWATPKEQKKNQ